jgi:chromosome segregation ATPase
MSANAAYSARQRPSAANRPRHSQPPAPDELERQLDRLRQDNERLRKQVADQQQQIAEQQEHIADLERQLVLLC